MSSSPRFVLALSLSLVAVAGLPAGAAPALAGDAVALTDDTPFRSVDPQVVALAGGGFFSVWENQNQGLWGRAVAADGTSATVQRLLVGNSPLPPNPGEGWWFRNGEASLAPLSSGGFLLVWTRELTYVRAAVFMFTSTPLRREVLAQRFTADGTPFGRQVRVDGDTALLNDSPRVAVLSPSRFLVVWAQEGTEGGLRARLLTGDSLPLGEEIAIAGPGADQPAVAVNRSRDALIAWRGSDGDGGGVFARLFDRHLVPVGDSFAVNTRRDLDQSTPRVAAGADGSFLVSWWSEIGREGRVRDAAQLVTAAGALAGGERLIGDHWETVNLAPNVTALPGGGYLHAWVIWNRWYAIGLYAEVLDAEGVPVDEPIRVSDSRPQGVHQLGLAVGKGGTVFVAWEGFNGNERGIRGRALTPGGPAAP